MKTTRNKIETNDRAEDSDEFINHRPPAHALFNSLINTDFLEMKNIIFYKLKLFYIYI